jgi:hypothetical protein
MTYQRAGARPAYTRAASFFRCLVLVPRLERGTY